MDVLSSMDIFCRVADAGSFSAVAREKDISQSKVSKHLAFLEDHLGIKLINRSTRQLSLTEQGSEYYTYCIRILNDIAEAEMQVSQGQSIPTGTLRVSATSTFGRLFILPFLWEFLSEHPKLNFDMVLEDRYVDLVKEGIDMAIRVGPLADSNMIARKLGESQRVIVASPQYIKAHGEPTNIEDLTQHECLIYSLQSSPQEWEFNTDNGIQKIKVSGRFRSTSPEAIAEASIAGLGISVVMLWSAIKHIKEGRLKIILTDCTPTPYEVNAVFPERRYVPQKVRLLIDHLRSSYDENYSSISSQI